MTQTKITFSLRTILVIVLTILGLALAHELRGLILTVFFAYIINAGLRPIVDKLSKNKYISRTGAIAITYAISFLIVLILGFVIFSTAFTQIRAFFTDIDNKILNFVSFIQNNLPFLNQYIDLESISANANNLSTAISQVDLQNINDGLMSLLNNLGATGISILGGVLGGVLSLFVIIMLSIYMLKHDDYVYKPLVRLLPQHLEKRFDPVLDKIEASLGSWMAGQILLMLIIGVITYLILIIPSFFDPTYPLARYALVLAIIAGLLEGVPSIGPVITLIVALVAAILSGAGVPILIFILIAFIILQQLEGVFIVPTVMKRAVDLHPIVSIIGAMAGLQLGGPIGALLSIPIVAMIQIIVLEVSKSYRNQKLTNKLK